MWGQANMKKFVTVAQEEIKGIHLKFLLIKFILKLIPKYAGARLRVRLLRVTGFKIGKGTLISGTPTIAGLETFYANFVIGEDCYININCHFDISAPITIGDGVSIGHHVLILTNSHEMGTAVRRAGDLVARPVQIDNGVWLGARSTILPGVIIGNGAVVAAGAMVTKDVPPHTVVAGVPAKITKQFPEALKNSPA